MITSIQREIKGLSDRTSQWYAVHTKFRSEKFVVENLQRQGVEAYVPLQTYVRQYGHKRREVSKPLIHQYIFVCISRVDYKKVLQTPYVYGFLRNGKDLCVIPLTEMITLKRVVGDVVSVESAEMDWAVGQKVEVVGGSLTGLQGLLLKQANKNYFTVQLQTLGWQLKIDIDRQLLRPIL